MKLWNNRGAWTSRKGRRNAAEMTPESVTKIAVIRHAALGDMVLTRPFLKAARELFPNAQITLSLTSNYTYGAPLELVDRVHTIYGQDQRDIPKLQQISRMRELGEQDIIFDLAATARSFQVTSLNPARLKVGFPYKRIQNHLYYDLGILRTTFRFEAEVMLDCLNIFGGNPSYPLEFSLPRYRQESSDKRIVYFFGASGNSKRYPEGDMINVIDQLAPQLPDYQHVILEGIKPDEKADHILNQLEHHPNVTHQPTLELDALTEWLAQSRLLICNDTGVRNLAIATHTPTLGIFFATTPYRYWPRYEPHYVVFNADGSLPAPAQVSAQALTAISELAPAQ